jgi:hypothetical protein
MKAKRSWGIRVLATLFFAFLFYGGYLTYIYFRLPAARKEISDIYTAAINRQAPDSTEQKSDIAGAIIQINGRTSDEELASLQNNPDTVKKAQSYDTLLNSGSMAILDNILKIIPGAAQKSIGADEKNELKAALEILKQNDRAVDNAAQEKN